MPSPLRTRNYRLYFSGQLISVPGTWLQTVAQAWLVLELSASGSALGVTVALQTVPVLILGAWTGSVADAVDKRRLLLATQATQGALALTLGILALTGAVELWMVWILALGLGLARAFDTPTRQAFVSELVETGPALARAIGINSTVVSAARMIGPAAAGVIIALVGVGVCFLINAASFLGPLCALLAMDTSKLHRPDVRAGRTPHAVRAGLSYVQGRRGLLIPLLMMALVGTLAFEFQVTIPLMAHSAFHLGATGFGLLYAAMGAGAVASGVTLAGRLAPRLRTLVGAASAFGAALAAAALAPGRGRGGNLPGVRGGRQRHLLVDHQRDAADPRRPRDARPRRRALHHGLHGLDRDRRPARRCRRPGARAPRIAGRGRGRLPRRRRARPRYRPAGIRLTIPASAPPGGAPAFGVFQSCDVGLGHGAHDGPGSRGTRVQSGR